MSAGKCHPRAVQHRLYIKAMLNSLDFHVIEACDGEQAIKIFDKSKIDLVMTDIFMPEKEGLSTINCIFCPTMLLFSNGMYAEQPKYG